MIALATIIERFGQGFLAQYGASALPSQCQALNAMKHCRSVLGPGMLAHCGDCGEQRVVPHVGADRKLTHLRPLCRLKTDPGVLLALPIFWAGNKQGDHHGNVGKNSTDAFARQGVVA